MKALTASLTREEVQKQMDEYLARKGKVEKVESGKSGYIHRSWREKKEWKMTKQ